MVPNVPWHRAPRRKGAPPHQEKKFKAFLINCHLYREPNYAAHMSMVYCIYTIRILFSVTEMFCYVTHLAHTAVSCNTYLVNMHY